MQPSSAGICGINCLQISAHLLNVDEAGRTPEKIFLNAFGDIEYINGDASSGNRSHRRNILFNISRGSAVKQRENRSHILLRLRVRWNTSSYNTSRINAPAIS